MVDFEASERFALDRMIIALDLHGAFEVRFGQIAELVKGHFRVEDLDPLGNSCNRSATLYYRRWPGPLSELPNRYCRRPSVRRLADPQGVGGSVRPDDD
ncbi:MAG TPA: hypothetical protein VJ995_01440 [Geothermobacteraceae bacterium]|nr:hypothetical protein [Geothermobacteraceae bacterium]